LGDVILLVGIIAIIVCICRLCEKAVDEADEVISMSDLMKLPRENITALDKKRMGCSWIGHGG